MMQERLRSALLELVEVPLHQSVVAEAQAFSSARRNLPLDPILPASIEEGRPIARGLTLTRSPDERLSSGLWECTAGKFKWTFWLDEIVLILDGEATVREETGAVHELRPGDVAYFPLGLNARWEISDHVRKFFVVRTPGGNGRVARIRERLRLAWKRAARTSLPWGTPGQREGT